MQVRHPQNARSKRAAKRRQPLVNENVKHAMFVKGHKTSQIVTEVLNDLHALKKPDALKYNKKRVIANMDLLMMYLRLNFFLRNQTALFLPMDLTAKKDHIISFWGVSLTITCWT